jgi:hypothetical protein
MHMYLMVNVHISENIADDGKILYCTAVNRGEEMVRSSDKMIVIWC